MSATLEPADYWQLRALTGDVEREQALAALAQARLELARARRQACWTVLAAQYGVPADRAYGLMDDACQLVEASTPAA